MTSHKIPGLRTFEEFILNEVAHQGETAEESVVYEESRVERENQWRNRKRCLEPRGSFMMIETYREEFMLQLCSHVCVFV